MKDGREKLLGKLKEAAGDGSMAKYVSEHLKEDKDYLNFGNALYQATLEKEDK